MMYFLLILFFGSLLGIIFMIGRKLTMIQNGTVLHEEDTFLKTQYLEEWKHTTIKNLKKYGYTGLVVTIRFYVQSSNFLKNKYQGVKVKIKNIGSKKREENFPEKQQISKFLKTISEYKHKIRQIKHKIKEEENL